ncbi:hypothetical protein DMENIID0001_161230 [Sergentomyia squamirostris]
MGGHTRKHADETAGGSTAVSLVQFSKHHVLHLCVTLWLAILHIHHSHQDGEVGWGVLKALTRLRLVSLFLTGREPMLEPGCSGEEEGTAVEMQRETQSADDKILSNIFIAIW